MMISEKICNSNINPTTYTLNSLFHTLSQVPLLAVVPVGTLTSPKEQNTIYPTGPQ